MVMSRIWWWVIIMMSWWCHDMMILQRLNDSWSKERKNQKTRTPITTWRPTRYKWMGGGSTYEDRQDTKIQMGVHCCRTRVSLTSGVQWSFEERFKNIVNNVLKACHIPITFVDCIQSGNYQHGNHVTKNTTFFFLRIQKSIAWRASWKTETHESSTGGRGYCINPRTAKTMLTLDHPTYILVDEFIGVKPVCKLLPLRPFLSVDRYPPFY